MSGNCASGIAKIAIRPASVITIETTKARRGRSMKTFEIILAQLSRCGLCGSAGGRRFARRHRHAGPHLLDALDDHPLARLQAVPDHRLRALRGAERDPPRLHLVVLADHQHVGAGLIDLERRLRHRQHRLGRARLDPDADELAVDQQALGIGQLGAHRHRVGALVDLHVEEVDLARLVVQRAVRQRRPGPPAAPRRGCSRWYSISWRWATGKVT